jgi:hypothetical protein
VASRVQRSSTTRGGVLRKLKVLVATLAMTLLIAAPAFAQGMTGFDESGFGGFNDLNVITFGGNGGNCVVGDFAEICTVF